MYVLWFLLRAIHLSTFTLVSIQSLERLGSHPLKLLKSRLKLRWHTLAEFWLKSWRSHSDAQKGRALSRTSATSSNNVGVSQITSAVASKQRKPRPPKSKAEFDGSLDEFEITSARPLQQSKSESKPKSAIMENTGGLSDGEDDSVERDSILKSPPKGGKRLSSVVSHSQPSLNLTCPLICCRLSLLWFKNHVLALIRVARRRASSVATLYLVGPNLSSQFSSITITTSCLHGRQRQTLDSVCSRFGTGDSETRIPLSLPNLHNIFSWQVT
jgi:hypothetical protein